MSIHLIGVNHKTAPVAIREKVAFSPQRLQEALHSAKQLVGENLILSTCNRTEMYVITESEQQQTTQTAQTTQVVTEQISHWLADFHSIAIDQLNPYLYRYEDEQAVQHILRVACGLDSLVLGEPQILGQLKEASHTALEQQALGRRLKHLTQHIFSAAKKIRTQTSIGANPVSVAYAAVTLSKQIFSDLSRQTALLIGAGETIELVGRHLKTHNIGKVMIANRSVDKAEQLAQSLAGEAIPLNTLSDHLHHADIVISSTAAPLPIVGKGMVERALKKRKHQPMFMVDIAVPRDIEAEVESLDDVFLYTVDDLQNVIQENQKSRQQAAEQAELLVHEESRQFMAWLQAQQQMGLIKDYRAAAYDTKNEVLEKALKRLKKGESAESCLQFLAHTLTNKLLHHPTKTLNQAAHADDQQLLAAAISLLNLQDKTQ
ncbi:MAG TPA: glutamyl-tRNA reductase [Thiothrix sp.]|nr:glutamyl-tRNA reductase [Thiothrix sp.]